MKGELEIIRTEEGEFKLIIPKRPVILEYMREILFLVNIVFFLYLYFSKKIIIYK